MIRIVICDDDKIFLNKLESDLRNILTSRNEEFCISKFESGFDFLKEADVNKTDVIYLDVDMPDLSGYQVAKSLSNCDKSPIIIFVSCKTEMVYDSYEYTPLWFIPKHKVDNMLEYVTNIMLDKLHIERITEKITTVETSEGSMELNPQKDMYLKSSQHYVDIIRYGKSAWKTFRARLDDVEEQVKGSCFVRIHNRYLVNLHFVEYIEENTCVLSNDEKLPISRTYITETKNKYYDFLRNIRNG